MFYRFISNNTGIYEAVDKSCPRNDTRRKDKPDGAWLLKEGHRYPGSISFWTEVGLKKYYESGLLNWHASVITDKITVLVLDKRPKTILYVDEFQIICPSDSTSSCGIWDFKTFRIRKGFEDNNYEVENLLIKKINVDNNFLKRLKEAHKMPEENFPVNLLKIIIGEQWTGKISESLNDCLISGQPNSSRDNITDLYLCSQTSFFSKNELKLCHFVIEHDRNCEEATLVHAQPLKSKQEEDEFSRQIESPTRYQLIFK